MRFLGSYAKRARMKDSIFAYCDIQIRPSDIIIQPMTLSFESFSLNRTADATALSKSTPALSKV